MQYIGVVHVFCLFLTLFILLITVYFRFLAFCCVGFFCLCNYLLIKYVLFNSIIVQTMCKLGKADSRSAQKCIICVTQIQLISKKKKIFFFLLNLTVLCSSSKIVCCLKGPVFCCAVKFLFFYIRFVFFCNKTMHCCVWFCNNIYRITLSWSLQFTKKKIVLRFRNGCCTETRDRLQLMSDLLFTFKSANTFYIAETGLNWIER